VKTLALAIIATVALLSATTVVHADSSGCVPTVEAANATETACSPSEAEEAEEEEPEYEEVTSEEVRSALSAASITGEPTSTSASAPSPPKPAPTTTKLATCRRASEATIRAEAKRIRRLKGRRRRSAERQLERELCR
jgi:hypothetical protein